MLDWPEQTHTSPTRTLVSFTGLSSGPVTVNSNGPPAGNGPIFATHFPSGPAVAVAVLPLKLTVTCLPGSVQPQTGSTTSRCSTMSLANSGWSSGLPGAPEAP